MTISSSRLALWSRCAGLIPALIATACANERQSSPFVVGDSASVRIVENTPPLETDSFTAWQLAPQPVTTIGVVDGAPEYQLYGVRHALRLDDGIIVLADGGSRELRFYDSGGRHIRSVGGDGEGPGEFRVISLLAHFGPDSLAVYDGRLERVSILDRDGRFGRSFRRPDLGAFVYVHGFFPDGSLLGSVDQGIDPNTLNTGVLRAHSVLFRMMADGTVDTVGRFFAGESYVKKAERASISSMPYARHAVRVIDGDRIHYGTSDTYEIRTYTKVGDLVRIVRLALPNAPLTSQDIDSYIEVTGSSIDDPQRRREFEARIREMPHAATLPAHGEMLVDTEGNLWVADYRLQGDNQPRWTIFDRDGRLLSRLHTPPGLTITAIGANYVLGVVRDDLNVEQLVLYELIKPAANRTE